MPVWIPSAIAAGASLIGGLLQNKGQRSAAREQMDFQKEMSNTAYRRSRADLEAAGYSPYLAYGQGGATSPSGAQANVSDVIGPAVSSAMGARRLREDVKLLEQQRANIYTDTQKKGFEGTTARIESELAEENRGAVSRAAVANARAAEADASDREWENSPVRRNQRMLFGNSGYIPGIGQAVGDVVGNMMPFGRFKNSMELIRSIGGRVGSLERSTHFPLHTTVRGFRR